MVLQREKKLQTSLALSLLAHMFFMGFFVFFLSRPQSEPKQDWVWVDLPPQDKAEESRSQRIVQTHTAEKTESAAKEAHLGKQNQIVDRQTVSRQQIIATGEASKPATEKSETETQESKADALPKKGALSHLGLAILPKAGEKSPQESHNWKKYSGLAPQDYVKGIAEGDQTVLNTKEYVFYGYFQRIRQRLDLAWNRRLRDQLGKMWRKGRTLASDSDHVTRVLVTLNNIGSITKVQILEESGTRDLDDAAVKAFNEAGPFPNPPRGIADADGQIQIRWDFVLKT